MHSGCDFSTCSRFIKLGPVGIASTYQSNTHNESCRPLETDIGSIAPVGSGKRWMCLQQEPLSSSVVVEH